MRERVFPVLVDSDGDRVRAGFSARSTEQPAVVALKLRERGWYPYKVSFDSTANVWIALILDSKRAA